MTKKKIFRYKFVYWINLIFTFSLSLLYNFALYTRIYNYVLYKTPTIDFGIITLIVFLCGILSVITFIMLIFKNKKSILLFTILLVLVAFNLFYGIYSLRRNIEKHDDYYDYYGVFLISLIIFGLIFMAHKYRDRTDYKNLNEIEEIGKPE